MRPSVGGLGRLDSPRRTHGLKHALFQAGMRPDVRPDAFKAAEAGLLKADAVIVELRA